MSDLRTRLEIALADHYDAYQIAESQGPIVDAILAVVEAGADRTPRPGNTIPSPGQLLAAILDAPEAQRLDRMRRILDNSETAIRCFERGHEAELRRLPALHRALTEANTERDKLAARLAEISRLVYAHIDARSVTTDGPGS